MTQPIKSYKLPVFPTTNNFIASCMHIDMYGVFYIHPVAKGNFFDC